MGKLFYHFRITTYIFESLFFNIGLFGTCQESLCRNSEDRILILCRSQLRRSVTISEITSVRNMGWFVIAITSANVKVERSQRLRTQGVFDNPATLFSRKISRAKKRDSQLFDLSGWQNSQFIDGKTKKQNK